MIHKQCGLVHSSPLNWVERNLTRFLWKETSCFQIVSWSSFSLVLMDVMVPDLLSRHQSLAICLASMLPVLLWLCSRLVCNACMIVSTCFILWLSDIMMMQAVFQFYLFKIVGIIFDYVIYSDEAITSNQLQHTWLLYCTSFRYCSSQSIFLYDHCFGTWQGSTCTRAWMMDWEKMFWPMVLHWKWVKFHSANIKLNASGAMYALSFGVW